MSSSFAVTERRRANPSLVGDSLCDHLGGVQGIGTIDGNIVVQEENALFETLAALGTPYVDCGESMTADGDFLEDVFKHVVTNKGVRTVVGRPALESRRNDADWIPEYMRSRGREYVGNGQAPTNATFELGDCIQDGDRMFVGLSTRTNDAGREFLRKSFADTSLEFIPVEISGGPHLDNHASVVARNTVLIDPRYADSSPFKRLGYDIIEVARDAEWGLASALRIQCVDRDSLRAACRREKKHPLQHVIDSGANEVIIVQGKEHDQHIQALRERNHCLVFVDYTHHRYRQGGLACKVAFWWTQT